MSNKKAISHNPVRMRNGFINKADSLSKFECESALLIGGLYIISPAQYAFMNFSLSLMERLFWRDSHCTSPHAKIESVNYFYTGKFYHLKWG